MRDLDDYQVIFCDIDDTLVYGFWTDLMRYSWDIFKCNMLSDILMTLQRKFKLYKVNQKLKYLLLNCTTPVIFLTARKYVPATEKMLGDILEVERTEKIFEVRNLATNHPARDKYNEIVKIIQDFQDLDVQLEHLILFDDNKDVRSLVSLLDIDVFDPTVLFEKGIY